MLLHLLPVTRGGQVLLLAEEEDLCSVARDKVEDPCTVARDESPPSMAGKGGPESPSPAMADGDGASLPGLPAILTGIRVEWWVSRRSVGIGDR